MDVVGNMLSEVMTGYIVMAASGLFSTAIRTFAGVAPHVTISNFVITKVRVGREGKPSVVVTVL
jgi:hypothetical protein